MTDKQALKKAQELFGKRAHIERRKPYTTDKGHKVSTHSVGTVEGENFIPMFFVKGHGFSWDEAFANVNVEFARK